MPTNVPLPPPTTVDPTTGVSQFSETSSTVHWAVPSGS